MNRILGNKTVWIDWQNNFPPKLLSIAPCVLNLNWQKNHLLQPPPAVSHWICKKKLIKSAHSVLFVWPVGWMIILHRDQSPFLSDQMKIAHTQGPIPYCIQPIQPHMKSTDNLWGATFLLKWLFELANSPNVWSYGSHSFSQLPKHHLTGWHGSAEISYKSLPDLRTVWYLW